MHLRSRPASIVSRLAVVVWLLSLAHAGLGSHVSVPVRAVAPDAELLYATGDLDPGETQAPSLPIYSTRTANLKLRVPVGSSSGAISLEFIDGSGANTFSGVALDGETLWASLTLKPGNNTVVLENASGAGGPELQYELWLYEADDVPVVWEGESLGLGTWRPSIRLNFPTSGLYEFGFGVASGRYQFFVDDEYIQKTAEASSAVTYYVAAGVHSLRIQPDPSAPHTAWSLQVSGPYESTDVLPFHRSGGQLGGTGNPFTEEWLPLAVAAGGQANGELTVSGDLADGLAVHLYHGSTLVGSTPVVHGGETFWWTVDLAAGVNRLEVETEAGSVGPLEYDLTVHEVSVPPATWSGVAKGSAGSSTVLLEVAEDATYHVTLDTPLGFAQVVVDEPARVTADSAAPLAQAVGFDVPLSAGLHSLQILQAATYSLTEWTLAVASTTPGSEIAHLSGQLDAGEEVNPQIPLFGTQDKEVNLRLEVAAAASTSLALTIWDGEGGEAFAGTALAGETLWATATLKPGQNTFQVHNTGADFLSYDLTVYEVFSAPYHCAGTSLAAGTWNSSFKLDFPSDALYQLDLGVESGRYQVLVDDDYIQKTADVDGLVSFYVPAGKHSLVILPDRVPGASWTLDISPAGASTDSLPYSQAGGQLWAQPERFNEEWLPLKVNTAAPANLELTLVGGSGDALDVYLYAGDSTTPVASFVGVYGGETVWWTADLPGGVSRIQLVADGANAGALSYEITVHEAPTLTASNPATWDGTSYGTGNSAHLRFQVDAAGIYEITYGVTSGRYQFRVSSEPCLQKTVEASGTARYYLTAGNHALTVIQDSVQGAGWSLEIAATTETSDVLPLQRSGGYLGGAGNDFVQEWWPVHLPTGTAANFELTLSGDLADSLTVRVLHEETAVYTSPVIYGGETFWWTTGLAGGTNVVELSAGGANAGALTYDLTIHTIPTVAYAAPHTWSGVSQGAAPAGNSEIEVGVPVTGTYHVSLDMPNGFATIEIGTVPSHLRSTQQAHVEFDVPLGEGSYLFRVLQSSSYLTTTWTATISLKSALAPEVYAVDPTTATNNEAHMLTVEGANFQPGAVLTIDSIVLGPVTRLDSHQLQATIPAGLTPGLYDVTVANPDAQWATLADALEVRLARYWIYLPLVAQTAP